MDRRQFLAAASAAFSVYCLPSALFSSELENQVVLRFAALSDVHFNKNHGPDARQRMHFTRMLRFMNCYSAHQAYPNFDALVVAGDITDHGLPEEILPFREVMDQNLKPETRRIMCMGNHEFYGGNKPLWEKTFGMPANQRVSVNGFQFITVSMESREKINYAYAVEWLEKELEAAAKETPGKPIFVVQHYPVFSTVGGSHNLPGDFRAGDTTLNAVLSRFPQVVDISGHSHCPPMDPTSVWQGRFTAFGCGSLSYYIGFGGHHQGFASYRSDLAGTAYVFEVYRGNAVRVRLYDTISESFWDREYLVCDPTKVENYVYLDSRRDSAKPPVWPKEARLVLEEVWEEGADFSFMQAEDADCMNGYRFTAVPVEVPVNGPEAPTAARYVTTDFHVKVPFEFRRETLEGLAPDTKYRLKVEAVNCWNKTSETALEAEFRTLAVTEPDRSAAKPAGNILSLSFMESGFQNTASERELRTHGKPEIFRIDGAGETLDGTFAARFDGKKDAFLALCRRSDYYRMTKELSIGARVRVEPGKNRDSEIFGNTEGNGTGLFVRGENFAFWISINGKPYRVLEAPAVFGRFVSVFGTYDGKMARFYVDGQEAASMELSGNVTFTRNETARAFCVGGDVQPNYETRMFLTGEIASAELYSWALTPEQIANWK